jgi:hypothetical protein
MMGRPRPPPLSGSAGNRSWAPSWHDAELPARGGRGIMNLIGVICDALFPILRDKARQLAGELSVGQSDAIRSVEAT